MKYFVLLFFLFCNSLFVFAQNKKIDSLNELIRKAVSDTQRINLMLVKMSALSGVNLDSEIVVGYKTIKAAQLINYKKGEAKARIFMAYPLCYKGEFTLAKETLDSSHLALSAIADSLMHVKFYNSYGIMYAMQNKYDTALSFYQKALAIKQIQKDFGLLANTYQNIAIAYQQVSNYPKSIEYYQKALQAAEKGKDESTQAFINLNLANTFKIIDDLPRSEQYYNKAIQLAIKLDLKNVETYAYANLSSLYAAMGKPDKQYEFGIKAAALAKELGDLGIEASSLSRAALGLAAQNKFMEAEKLCRSSLTVANSSSQPLNIYQTFSDMGIILKMQKKYGEAIPYFQTAFKSLSESDLYDNEVNDSYLSYSECLENTGDYNKALSTYKIASQINDSLRNKENIRKATELTMNYEFNKKQEITKAEQQKKDEVSEARQKALLFGLALTFILAVVAYNGFRTKRKSNVLLQRQKEEIQNTLGELKSTQAQLIQSEKMASLGELTAGIAHEIQNPLNFVNNFSEVNKELLEELKDEANKGNMEEVKSIAKDVIENSEKINHHGKRADAIVKGMLQHSRKSEGTKEPIDINALCDEYLRLSYHGLRAKDKSFNADFKTYFDNSVGRINIVPQDIGRVLLNLYTNAFYSVNEKKKLNRDGYNPAVSVSTKLVGKSVEIRIADNGNGVPQNVVDKIFQPFFTTKPTGQGTGLGLSLSYDIIKAHQGQININNKPGEGVEFVIELPI